MAPRPWHSCRCGSTIVTFSASLASMSWLDWSSVSVSTLPEAHGPVDLLLSNGDCPLPPIHHLPHFLDEESQQQLYEELNTRDFSREGLDRSTRVQRYSVDDEDLPDGLRDLLLEFHKVSGGFQATHVMVEERPRIRGAKLADRTSLGRETMFETATVPDDAHDGYFVAQLPLLKPAIQQLNRPLRRTSTCFRLESDQHTTFVRLEPGSLLVRSGDALWNWRTTIDAAPEIPENIFVVKLYCLPVDVKPEKDEVEFGYVPSDRDTVPDGPMPPLEDLLTILLTTSPIRSTPSTEMTEKTMETFVEAGDTFAHRCRKVIVCDGYRLHTGDARTKTYATVKQAMRNGIVDDEQAEKYRQYKEKLKELCRSATPDSPFANTRVEELDTREGYGFALRHALRKCVDTHFVCVIQHDRTFMRPTPIVETVRAMWYHRNIKYIGMNMRSNLRYRDTFLSKYGKSYRDDFVNMILRVPELLVDATEYGPGSRSAELLLSQTNEQRTPNAMYSLAESYNASKHQEIEVEHRKEHPVPDGKCQITLTPTLFWNDNTHVCETEHYRDFIFHPPYKMVARGGFVEDKLSPVMKRTTDRLGLVEGHSRFGCYILDDHSGLPFTGHLDGGSYRLAEEKQSNDSTTSE